MSTILVIGASQGIGLEAVKALLGDGHRVRAFARSAASIPITDPNLEKVAGDALSKDDLARALGGTDAVILTLGVPMSLNAMLSGMNAHGPKRLICVTGLGAGDSRGKFGMLYDGVMFPVFLKRIYDDKDIQERIVRDSKLTWTIARPGVLVSAPITGHYRALDNPKDWDFKTVARADVARFLADEIRNNAFIHKTPLIIQ